MTKSHDNEAMVGAAVEKFGGVDILLANAGIEGEVASILDYDETQFDRVMAVNVKGPFLGLRAAVPEIANRPPNLCSGCSDRATFYAIKKAAQGFIEAIVVSPIKYADRISFILL